MTTLHDALGSLGLESQEQKIALLQNMFFDGVFEPAEVWNSTHRLQKASGEHDDTKARIMAYALMGALKQARAYEGDPGAFNAETLLNTELKSEITLTTMQDWITYSRQSSYGRKAGMERFELPDDDRLDQVKERYLQNAETLGMVSTTFPTAQAYDESWVQGASRPRIESRLNFLLDQQSQGLI